MKSKDEIFKGKTFEDLTKDIQEIMELAKKPRLGIKTTYGEEKVEWPNVPFATEIPNEMSIVESIGKIPIVPCLQKAIMVENPTHEARVYTTSWYRDILSLGEKNIDYEKINENIDQELKYQYLLELNILLKNKPLH